jgi:hypothetical protein
MNAQLDHILVRQRTTELEHAGAQARLAREARMSGRKLRHRKLITCLRVRPARTLRQLTATGPDGNVWFTDTNGAIGRIGSGAAPALAAPASGSGAGRQGSPVTCQTLWSSWARYAPFPRLYQFDGYAWLRNGTPIAGQTAPRYVPTARDIGHRLACRAIYTYPLPFSLTATATSGAITVPPAPPPPPTPALSALDITPRMFTLARRRFGGRCQPSGRSNRGKRSCTGRVAMTVRFALSGGATVVNGGAGADAFTFTGKIDGRALVPGTYLLLATPTTDGVAGQHRQMTFETSR